MLEDILLSIGYLSQMTDADYIILNMVEEALWTSGLLVQRRRDNIGVDFLLLNSDAEIYISDSSIRIVTADETWSRDKVTDISLADPELTDRVCEVCLSEVYIDD